MLSEEILMDASGIKKIIDEDEHFVKNILVLIKANAYSISMKTGLNSEDTRQNSSDVILKAIRALESNKHILVIDDHFGTRYFKLSVRLIIT